MSAWGVVPRGGHGWNVYIMLMAPIGTHQKSTHPALKTTFLIRVLLVPPFCWYYLFWQALRHFGMISVFLVVDPSFDSTLAYFSKDCTIFLLVWNSGMNRLKSMLSP
jgi:hypothetical protein